MRARVDIATRRAAFENGRPGLAAGPSTHGLAAEAGAARDIRV